MLEQALQSSSVQVLAWVALALGFLHTVLGPDHYVPFAVLARSEGWSRARTFTITALCGAGHVVSSVVIAVVLVAAGTAAEHWESTWWAGLHEARGDLSAWLLMGVGAAYAVWGVRRAIRNRPHRHVHLHPDGSVHEHVHDHSGVHAHPHGRTLTPWVLFIIFVFGPCESLIPLVLAAWALAGIGAAVLVAVAFSLSTVITILASVWLLLAGLDLVPLGKLERWTGVIAGASLVACGAAILFLGL